MKKRRQLKNIGSAKWAREKAMTDRQSKESEINELKIKLELKEKMCENEKRIRLMAEKQNQVL